MKIATIKWKDASYQRGEATVHELTTECVLVSSGILVKKSRDAISIALDVYDEEQLYRHICHIPMKNVERIILTELNI